MLEANDSEYDVMLRAIAEAAKACEDPLAMTIEIGVRRGGGSKLIVEEFRRLGQHRFHVLVDPYGDLPYQANDGPALHLDYADWMRRKVLHEWHAWAEDEKVDSQFFWLTDDEFFRAFADGIPFYVEGRTVQATLYAFAYLDGPHCRDFVTKEVEWFLPRMAPGGVLCFDDIGNYEHQPIRDRLVSAGWEMFADNYHQEAWRRAKEVRS